MFCYRWFDKKCALPCIGFMDGKVMDHPALLQEKRSRMRIYLLDPTWDLPVRTIDKLLRKGIILKLAGTRSAG